MARKVYPRWYHRMLTWGELPNRGKGGRYRVKGIKPTCTDDWARASTRQILKRELRRELEAI